MTYKIVRYYQRAKPRVIARGLTLDEAQAHCNDPETSSATCTGSGERAHTRSHGPWFDGYTREE